MIGRSNLSFRRDPRSGRLWIAVAIACASTAFSVSAQAGEGSAASAAAATLDAAVTAYSLDPATTSVRFTLDTTLHLVRGTARLVRGQLLLAGDGKLTGEVVIDATSLETGNRGRDEDMHQKVLESRRFPTIVLHPGQLVGAVPQTAGVVSQAKLHGELEIHGGRHPILVAAQLERDGERLKVNATFTVPYIAWGMKDPSKFILSAAKEVTVELTTVATPLPAGATRPPA